MYAGSFLAGATISASIAGSLRLLDDAGKLPGNAGQETYQPVAATGLLYSYSDYNSVSAFMLGAVVGAKGLEGLMDGMHDRVGEVYRENGLDELWDEVREDEDDY